MFKTIFVRSDFLNQDNDISIDIENDTHSHILKKLEKYIDGNLDLSMFDLEQVSGDGYTLDLNDKGKFYLKVKSGGYKNYFSEDLNCKNFDKYINYDLLLKSIENKDLQLMEDIIIYKPKLMENKNYFGKNVLYIVSCLGNLEMVKILLKYNIKFSDYEKDNNILDTVSYYGYTEIVKELLKPSCGREGISFTYDDNGDSALSHAVDRGYSDIVEILLNPDYYTQKHTYPINFLDENKRNSLHYAAFYGKLDMVKILLKKGVQQIQDKNGETPLIQAVYQNYLRIVRKLLNSSKNITVALQTPDFKGKTPLHYACKYGNIRIVEELLKYNPMFISDNKGKTPLDVALKKKHLKIVEMIKKHFSL